MEARRSWATLAGIQGVLLALCAASALVFGCWVLGSNGLGLFAGDALPRALWETIANPHEQVLVQGEEGLATAVAGQGAIGGSNAGRMIEPGDANFFGNPGNLSLDGATGAQHLAWVTVRALPALGLALIWWLLYLVVRDVRREQAFSERIVRRLQVIGLLVLVGVPAIKWLRWEVAGWLVETSKAAPIADVASLRLDAWPFAVGLVILVLASVCGQAASMREDLEGVV